MSYTVLARKWRPRNFAELIGQEHVGQTLKNAILNDRIAHGYIFTGSRGVGKTSAARIFAKALNCANLQNGEPCNTCPPCTDINEGRSLDVIEIDGASNNSVDNIRDLRENVRFAPSQGRFKIYIIDEVHMLSKGAFNALLKTLEEPPEHVIFIFATTEIHKVLPTILSRCQRFDFKRIPITRMIERLRYITDQEGISIEDAALMLIAKKADGGMRDSQSILDQLISFCGTTITLADVNATLGVLDSELLFRFTETIANGQTGEILNLVDQTFQQGVDLVEVVHGLEEHFRNLLVCISQQSADLIDAIPSDKERYLEQAKRFTEMDVLRMVKVIQQTEQMMRHGYQPKIKLELALSKLCEMDRSVRLSDVIDSLEKKNTKIAATPTPQSKSAPLAVGSLSQEQRITPPAQSTQTQTARKPIDQTIAQAPTEQSQHERSIPSPAATGPVLTTHSNSDVNRTEIPTNSQIQTNPAPPTEPLATSIKEPENPASETLLDSAKWADFIESFKASKPNLYNTLRFLSFKSVEGRQLNLLHNDDSNGQMTAKLVRNSEEFLINALEKRFHQRYKLNLEAADFQALGIVIERKDLAGIVERYRSENPKFREIMDVFDLKPISMGKRNGH